MKLVLIIFIVIVLSEPTATVGADAGALSVNINEPNVLVPLPCRAWISIGDKRFFEPATESCTPYSRDRSFSCDGHFKIRVPADKAIIHVERGKEYVSVDKEVIVANNHTTKVDITLKRWISMYKEGWYSSDMVSLIQIDIYE